MVKFDELRISEDGNYLTIQCRVENYDIYKDMYISSICLEYYRNRGTVGIPSDSAMEVFTNINPDPSSVRSVRVRLTPDMLPPDFGTSGFRGGLFYVYVFCDGALAPETAMMNCTYDNTLEVGVVIDWKLLYDRIMPLVAQFASSCSPCDIGSDFENLILLWNAFRFAVDTCDWEQVERIWDELMGFTGGGHKSSGCGCGPRILVR